MPAMAPSDPLAAYRMHQPPAMPEERSYSLRESHALREHSFIQNTEHQLDAFIAQGRSMLGNLVKHFQTDSQAPPGCSEHNGS